MHYIKISKVDTANGPGVRVVLWVAGCSHRCKGCHNPETWDYENGKLFDDAAKIELFEALSKPYVQGITFSGGDPLYPKNRSDTIDLMRELRQKFPDKDIWLYTGYSWEELKTPIPDVVVDGEFKQELKDITLAWRGSRNQRVIDVAKTWKAGEIVLYENNINV